MWKGNRLYVSCPRHRAEVSKEVVLFARWYKSVKQNEIGQLLLYRRQRGPRRIDDKHLFAEARTQGITKRGRLRPIGLHCNDKCHGSTPGLMSPLEFVKVCQHIACRNPDEKWV